MALPRVILIIVFLNSLVLIGSTGLNIYLLSGAGGAGAERMAPADTEGKPAARVANREYQFFPVEKVIVNLRGDQRERYFVLDLALQADLKVPPAQLQQLDPIVRNSVVAKLSAMDFETLRSMPIGDLQLQLEEALSADLKAKQLHQPFDHVLGSKMIVQ